MKNFMFMLAVMSTIVYICSFIYTLLKPKPIAGQDLKNYKQFISVNSLIIFLVGFCWTCYLYHGGYKTYVFGVVVGIVFVVVLHYIYEYVYAVVNKVECLCPENLDGMDIEVLARINKRDYIVRLIKDDKPKEMIVELYSDSDVRPGDKFILHYQDGLLHAKEYDGAKRKTKTNS